MGGKAVALSNSMSHRKSSDLIRYLTRHRIARGKVAQQLLADGLGKIALLGRLHGKIS